MKNSSALVLLFAPLLLAACGRQTPSAPPPTAELPAAGSPAAIHPPVPAPAAANRNEPPTANSSAVAKSRAGGDIFAALSAMHELLKEWNPVGASTGDLQAKLGPPTEASAEKWVYRFDHGKGGWEWVFGVANGTVTTVQKSSLE